MLWSNIRIFPLPVRFSGPGIPIFHKIEYQNLMFLSVLMREKSSLYFINEFRQQKLKNEITTKREVRYKNTLTQLQNRMNDNEKRLNTITLEKKCICPIRETIKH